MNAYLPKFVESLVVVFSLPAPLTEMRCFCFDTDQVRRQSVWNRSMNSFA